MVLSGLWYGISMSTAPCVLDVGVCLHLPLTLQVTRARPTPHSIKTQSTTFRARAQVICHIVW